MNSYSIKDLQILMERLRDPNKGCPWDIAQSYKTIAPSTIEEAYEVVDAIEKEDFAHLKEELGDLLFQVIFYAQLGKEENRFDFDSIASALVEKLIRRHPHVFPDGTLESQIESRHLLPDDVKEKWEAIKKSERTQKGNQGVLDDVPVHLPSLSRAAKLQRRAASVGFDWRDIAGPLEKVREELLEVEAEIVNHNSEKLAEEIGDLLFAVVNVARYLKLDPEQSLRLANQKFERRFRFIEDHSVKPLSESSLKEMDDLWDEAKARGL